MSDKTKIDWTDAACKHCYAERDWALLSANPQTRYYGRAFTDVQCHPELLDQPLRWKRPRRIFVNGMSDLFHEAVPDEFILQVFDVIRRSLNARGHIFQILTKRAGRMQDFCSKLRFDGHADGGRGRMWLSGQVNPGLALTPMLENLWLGVTAENQESADERIPLLLRTPAAVRFVSVEPMLSAVDMTNFPLPDGGSLDALRGIDTAHQCHYSGRLRWVIVGGESGPRARPMHPDWVRSLRDQCQAAGVPFFFKQWGEWLPICEGEGDWYDHLYVSNRIAGPNEDQDALDETYGRTCTVPVCGLRDDGHTSDMVTDFSAFEGRGMQMFRVGKKRAGRFLEGRTWEEMPV